jgi:hypothetical protein
MWPKSMLSVSGMCAHEKFPFIVDQETLLVLKNFVALGLDKFLFSPETTQFVFLMAENF